MKNLRIDFKLKITHPQSKVTHSKWHSRWIQLLVILRDDLRKRILVVNRQLWQLTKLQQRKFQMFLLLALKRISLMFLTILLEPIPLSNINQACLKHKLTSILEAKSHSKMRCQLKAIFCMLLLIQIWIDPETLWKRLRFPEISQVYTKTKIFQRYLYKAFTNSNFQIR